jgi:hypothetical protein
MFHPVLRILRERFNGLENAIACIKIGDLMSLASLKYPQRDLLFREFYVHTNNLHPYYYNAVSNATLKKSHNSKKKIFTLSAYCFVFFHQQ